MTVTILFCTTGWILGWWALGRLRPIGDANSLDGSVPDPGVTIIIPARDEELSLGGLLSDLARGRPAGARVVVVDDHSVDRTAAIADRFDFVEVIPAPDLPRDWTGKSWACHQGSLAATDGVLVFLDADVRLRPGAVDRLVAIHRRTGGLVSVQPWHDTVRPYEKLSALFNVIALMGAGAGRRRGALGAFGPVMVTDVSAYRRSGGHAATRHEVVEDLALARNHRAAEVPVDVLVGADVVRFRMYPKGLGQLSEGWAKNFALGAGSTPAPRLAAIAVWVAASGSAAFAVLDAFQGQVPMAVAAVLYGAFVGQLTIMFRRVGRFGPLTALLFPVLLGFFLVVFARSIWLTHVRRSVRWRGRMIPVGTVPES